MAAWAAVEQGRHTALVAVRTMLVLHTDREVVRRTGREAVRHTGLAVVRHIALEVVHRTVLAVVHRIDLAEGHTGPAGVRTLVVLAGRSLVAEDSLGSSFAIEGLLSGVVAVINLCSPRLTAPHS